MTGSGVFGSRGRMGAEVCRAVESGSGLGAGCGASISAMIAHPPRAAEVMVDFTHPDAVMDNLFWCIDHGIHAVVVPRASLRSCSIGCATTSREHDGVGVADRAQLLHRSGAR